MIANYGGHATSDQALGEVVQRLVAALNPVAIYLFGSRAHGTSRPDSDFDLMVLTRAIRKTGRFPFSKRPDRASVPLSL